MASTTSTSAAHAANSNSNAFKSAELPHLDGVEAAKRAAAYAAVDNHVMPHHEIIGIGSGKFTFFLPASISSRIALTLHLLIAINRLNGPIRS